ncbi:WD repeat-containing protein 19 [Homalodisca vitripennis]|nr:WD repeat-containing protein 19 [Homalodisca vitripennis]
MAHEKELFKLEQPHGPGQVYFSWQHGSGGYLATTGADNTVCIFNRHGKVEQRIRLPGQCIGLDWDCYGDLLAVICANATTLVLWDANTTKKSTVEVGLRDKLSCLVWAKTSPLLAVTTHSGNLSIYNHSTANMVKVPLSKNGPILTPSSKGNHGSLGGVDAKVHPITPDQFPTMFRAALVISMTIVLNLPLPSITMSSVYPCAKTPLLFKDTSRSSATRFLKRRERTPPWG